MKSSLVFAKLALPMEGEQGEQRLQQQEIDKFFDSLKKDYEHADVGSYIEIRLAATGLLEKLEETGILPQAEYPNPFDPEKEPEESKKWRQEHSEEYERFVHEEEKREDILKYLYVGAVLGRLFGSLLPGRKTISPRFPSAKGK